MGELNGVLPAASSTDLLGIELLLETTVGEAAVAVGTGLLAFFTWRLASQTKAEVLQTRKELNLMQRNLDLTQQSVDLTRESIEAADMPYVVPSPPPNYDALLFIKTSGAPGYLSLRLWNIGKGPGVVTDVQLHVDGRDWLKPPQRQWPVHTGGVRDERCYVDDPPAEFPGPRYQGEMRVYYSHASGTQYMTRSRVEIVQAMLYCADFSRGPSDEDDRSVVVDDAR